MPDTDTKPSAIGGFELLATLGKGGMGVVFKARQVSMDRIVALKVLPPNLAKDETYVSRFLREARSAAKLNHPNIVQGIDVGEAGGHYYFAMEFVDGFTVKELIRRQGRIEEKQALNIVGGVARALEHAAKHGIIHRDIKPDNIMISREGAVKLADLGLARTVEKPDTLTIEGTALGTPYYMAPEQIRGTTQLDTRTDIYALGATLFHMVTGEFAYDGPNAGAIMARNLADPVPSAKERHPEVTRATDELIQRMMAKAPADRPHTPSELLQEIKDALAGKVHLRPKGRVAQPPSAVVGGHLPRESQPRAAVPHQPKSKTTLIATIAVVAILAIAGLVLALRPGSKPDSVARPPSSVPQPPSSPSSVPQPPTTTTQHPTPAAKTPEDAKQATPVVVVDDAEAKRKAAELAEKERIAKAQEEAAATERQQAEELRRKAEAAAAAYQAESDKVWALFKKRDYPEADKLLLNLPRVANPREVLLADQEAAKLLKEFWSAVERGVMARKGKFVSIAGNGGNVESVADGQVTLKVGAKEFTQPLLGMAAAQAAALADLKDDERGNLVKAVFLLAEGEKLDDAEKLLAAAGKAPGLAVYKDRLDALTLGAAEVAARKAWAEIEATAKPKPTKAEAQRLLAALDAFEQTHGKTKHFAAVREKLADLRASSARLTGAPADGPRFFYGNVRLRPDGRAEFHYDWGDDTQLRDWEPWEDTRAEIVGKELRLGTEQKHSILSHKAQLVGDIEIRATWRILEGKEYSAAGFRFCHGGDRYYCVCMQPNTQRLFKRPSDVTLRRGNVASALGRAHTIRLVRSGATIKVWINGTLAAEGTDDEYTDGRVGFDVFRERGAFADVHVIGKVDPAWLAANREAAAQLAGEREGAEAPKPGQWQSLFDGKTMKGWQPVKLPQDRSGKAYVEDGRIVLDMVGRAGNELAWAGPFPTMNYELELDGTKLDGEYVLGVIFPVGTACCNLGLGDSGGSLDMMDGKRGWENVSMTHLRLPLKQGQPCRCRLRVTDSRIQAWLGDDKLFDLRTGDHKFSLYPCWAPVKSIALCTWNTKTSYGNVRFRRVAGPVEEAAEAPKAGE